jgi:predicted HAD superfamily Cof-like phosphohydrolase
MDFMHKAGQEIPNGPIIPNEKILRLRASLILEEALETINALGFVVGSYWNDGTQGPTLKVENMRFVPHTDGPNLEKIVDGCADVSVVTIGTLVACGIPDTKVLEEVDMTNLDKFGPGSYRREDGKWMKPPDFVGPDIKGILAELGWR